ncbi:uncharacterized protein LOC117222943 [Megalopta genalis]|uniref:uncharacterized protein LOC117222943 n=1 Tax=Megalopta genalis TaxID=115081 RepID=UPI003FD177C1
MMPTNGNTGSFIGENSRPFSKHCDWLYTNSGKVDVWTTYKHLRRHIWADFDRIKEIPAVKQTHLQVTFLWIPVMKQTSARPHPSFVVSPGGETNVGLSTIL